ncbi:MAG: ribonuclease R [Butyricicoccus sp.]|nr:ribonuclease R [Butyricicoccus sp.]
MNELEQKLYDLLARPVRQDELRKFLPGAGKNEIVHALAKLSEQGLILKNKKNRWARAEHYGCIRGRFSATERGYGFVIPDEPDGQGDVFVPAYDTMDAWEGDRVLVRLVEDRSGRHKRQGAVIRLLALNNTELDGVVMLRGRTHFVRPTSRRFPDLIIPRGGLNGARPGDRVAVRVIYRGDEYNHATGEIVKVFGQAASMESSIAAILHSNGIIDRFPEDVLALAAHIEQEVDPTEAARRLDLRELTLFTIDGDDAKDFDDAVSLEYLENGHLRLGVHIADVSHYVTPNSPLDAEAWRRGTSVYYPGHVVPMLPFELSNGICSLNPHVDRLAFSAFIELDRTGQRYGAKFAKTVIRSAARMTYKKVNAILSGDPALREEYSALVPTFEEMNDLAHALYKRRVDRGALELELPEAAITVDETGEPVEVTFRERGESEKLIEEFMLLANESVAEHMHRHGWPTVYRVHDDPDPEKLRSFAMFARPFGYRIDPSKTADTAQLQAVLIGAKDDPRQRALPTLLLRSLSRARYDLNCGGHYGLQAKFYLHFTSPIRRYPDLVAHWMLQKALTGAHFEPADEGFCAEAAAQSTDREFAADTAERDIDKLYLAAYMEQFIGEEFDAEVSGVTSFGLFVCLPNSVEGLIRMDALPDDYYDYDEEAMVRTGRHRGRRYTIGTPMRVRLLSASRINGQIDFAAADTPAPRKD